MALSCIWFRRACSQRAVLGEPIPPGSRLERHLSVCPGCRETWSDLRMLASDLDRLVTVPQPSASYAEPIWDHARPPVRSYRWGSAALAAAGACGLACGFIWWRFAPNVNRPQTTVVLDTPHSGTPYTLPDKRIPIVPPQDTRIEQARHDGYDNLAIPVREREVRPDHWRRNRIRFRTDRLAANSRHRRRQTPAVDISNSPEALRASGMIYEAQGDPGLANVAYRAAYREHPTDETAFDVGRSAEESGDMEQALDTYAGLLEAAAARTQPQKGWTP